MKRWPLGSNRAPSGAPSPGHAPVKARLVPNCGTAKSKAPGGRPGSRGGQCGSGTAGPCGAPALPAVSSRRTGRRPMSEPIDYDAQIRQIVPACRSIPASSRAGRATPPILIRERRIPPLLNRSTSDAPQQSSTHVPNQTTRTRGRRPGWSYHAATGRRSTAPISDLPFGRPPLLATTDVTRWRSRRLHARARGRVTRYVEGMRLAAREVVRATTAPLVRRRPTPPAATSPPCLLATSWTAIASELPACLVRADLPDLGLIDLAPLLHTRVNDKLGLDPVRPGR